MIDISIFGSQMTVVGNSKFHTPDCLGKHLNEGKLKVYKSLLMV